LTALVAFSHECESIPTFQYILVNLAYFSALSPYEILDSDAVAVTFASRVLGPLAGLVPLFVALSCIGSLNGVWMLLGRCQSIFIDFSFVDNFRLLAHVFRRRP
jgi:hypothetical protein